MQDNLVSELLKGASGGAVIGFIVWWTLRDHAKILRSIDLRLSKVLERVRVTPPMGVPIDHDVSLPAPPIAGRTRARDLPRAPAIRTRQRSHHDSDMSTDSLPPLPRTVTDEDMDDGRDDGDNGGKGRRG